MIDEATDLYALDPADFVAARNALAKRLRTDKRRADAADVTALRKPSLGAWALNRLARAAPEALADALEAGAALRDAGREGFRAATAAERAATDAAVDLATEPLGDRAAGLRTDLAATVRAAAHDEALAIELRAGCLTELRSSSGFGDLTSWAAPEPALARAPVGPQALVVSVDERRIEEGRIEEGRIEAERVQAELDAAERIAAARADAERRAAAHARAAALAGVADAAEADAHLAAEAAIEARRRADDAQARAAAARAAAEEAARAAES